LGDLDLGGGPAALGFEVAGLSKTATIALKAFDRVPSKPRLEFACKVAVAGFADDVV
jgi:hypothetical protein